MFKMTSIQNKVILSILGIIVFFGLIASIGVGIFTNQSLTQTKKNDLITITVSQGRELNQIFIHSERFVEEIAKEGSLQEYFLQREGATDEEGTASRVSQEEKILEDFTRYNIDNLFSAVYLMDREGKALVSTDQEFVGKNFSFRHYFQGARAGEATIDWAVGSVSKEAGYYFSHPVESSSGSILGVIVAKLNPESLHSILDEGSLVFQNNVMITDRHGIILHSNIENRIYQSLGPLSNQILRGIEESRRFPSIEIVPLAYDETLQAVSSYIEPVVIENTIQSSKHFTAVTRINTSPFYFIVEDDVTAIFDASITASLLISMFVALAAISASITIWLIVSRFLRPIGELQEMAEAIKLGNFDKRVELRTRDEFESLANALNEMSERISSSYEKLNQEVKKKTKELRTKVEELEKLNDAMVGREITMAHLKKKIKELELQIKNNNDN